MSRFTPGDWHFNEHTGEVFTLNNKVIAKTASLGIDETQANGRLTAAAPEMYKKLRDCIKFVEHHDFMFAESIRRLLLRIDYGFENN